ncbi:MAG: hypothetical protein ABEJ86_00025 [Halococcoides sp.]
MPLFFTGPEDDEWTTFVVVLSFAAIATLGVTVFLGYSAFSASPETTDPIVAVLFGVALTAIVVIGAELWAVSPLPGKTHPLYANEADGENRTLYVGGLAMAALMMFGVAALRIYLQFVAQTGPMQTLMAVNIGVSLAAGTVLTARVLNVLYRSSPSEGRTGVRSTEQ